MKKNLIVIGEQGVGKTLLGEWIDNSSSEIYVYDGVSLQTIKKYEFGITRVAPRVYITNENATYEDFNPNEFLIIKLTAL